MVCPKSNGSRSAAIGSGIRPFVNIGNGHQPLDKWVSYRDAHARSVTWPSRHQTRGRYLRGSPPAECVSIDPAGLILALETIAMPTARCDGRGHPRFRSQVA